MIPAGRIESAILFIRGEKVMLGSDLAELYGVGTKALNQAVKRNIARFPEDFMFRLTLNEIAELNRSQIVTGARMRLQRCLRSQIVTSKRLELKTETCVTRSI